MAIFSENCWTWQLSNLTIEQCHIGGRIWNTHTYKFAISGKKETNPKENLDWRFWTCVLSCIYSPWKYVSSLLGLILSLFVFSLEVSCLPVPEWWNSCWWLMPSNVSTKMFGAPLVVRLTSGSYDKLRTEKDWSYTMDLCDYWCTFDTNNHVVTNVLQGIVISSWLYVPY